LALKALTGALVHGKNVPSCKVHLHLVVLGPEEMVFYLAACSGQRQHERLFGLYSLLEFFRSYRGPINWQRVADIAKQYNLGHQVYAGLLMANPLLDQPVSVNDLARFNCPEAPQRMLQWARYGPASLARYTSFKALFFRVFTLLSIKGWRAKLKYLGGPASDRGRGTAFLAGVEQIVRLGAELLTIAWQGKKRYTATDLAYWTEPEPVIEATGGTSHL
jgi:hypothetical protein